MSPPQTAGTWLSPASYKAPLPADGAKPAFVVVVLGAAALAAAFAFGGLGGACGATDHDAGPPAA